MARALCPTLFLALAALAGCRPAPATCASEACVEAPRPVVERADGIDEVFFEAASRLLEDQLEARPQEAVALGLHDLDGQVRDMSADAIAADKTRLATALDELRGFDPASLRPRARVERAALISALEAERFELEVLRGPWRNPMIYVNELDLTPYISRDYAPKAARARALAKAARAGVELLGHGARNLEPYLPRTFVDTALLQTRGMIGFVDDDVPAAMTGLAQADRAELDAALAVLSAALRDYEAMLVERSSSATDDFALGPERLEQMLRETQGIELDVETLARIANADLERNLAALDAVARQLDPRASTAEVMARIAEVKPPPDQVLAAAKTQADEARAFLVERGLVTIPSDNPVKVVPTPAFMRWNIAFLDSAGPFEREPLPSFYYISPPDPAWPEAEQIAYVPSEVDLLFITVHEVWPGHFLHGLHVTRNDSHILQALWNFTTGEGWAHYGEQMMADEGFAAGPEARLGQLQNALLRDVRFVCALGLHTGSMTLDEATALFETKAFQDPVSARQQAVRGTFDPMYLGYTLGKLFVLDLRADWQASRRAAGLDDSLRRFHDELLGYAAAPLPAIREAMLGPDAGPAFDGRTP